MSHLSIPSPVIAATIEEITQLRAERDKLRETNKALLAALEMVAQQDGMLTGGSWAVIHAAIDKAREVQS